jgi:hypothetical protein
MHLVTDDGKTRPVELYRELERIQCFLEERNTKGSAMIIPPHWKVFLEDFGKADSGAVVTRDGEVIGTWAIVDDVFYTFTPDGAAEPIFTAAFLGMLCSDIAEWHEERAA